MFLKNCWYVAAWSHEVTADGLFARTIANTPLVFFRDDTGKVGALIDRCCHRGAPLSKGQRQGERIRCPYHGLKFSLQGECVEVPWQSHIPPQVRIRRHKVHEQHEWIWVWMGDPMHGDITDIPLTPWLDDPAWRYVPGYLHYPVQHLLIADNLLDFSHLPYVHPTTLGGTEEYAKVMPTIERLPRGIRVTRWLRDQPAAPYVTQIKAWPGNVDRWNIYDFLVPGILIMDSGSAPSDTGAPQGTRVDACEFRGCQAITPETENSTHYFFSQPHNFGFDQPGLTEAIHQNIVDAFFEDQTLIKAQRDNLVLAPEFSMLPMAIDAALVQYRSIFDRLLAAEAMT